MRLKNISLIPYKDILNKENYKDLIYQLNKLIMFIGNDGNADFSKSMFNVKGLYPNEIIMAKHEFDVRLQDYIQNSISCGNFRFFYLADKESEMDPEFSFSSVVNTSGDSSSPVHYITYIFTKEFNQDDYLYNLLIDIIIKSLSFRFINYISIDYLSLASLSNRTQLIDISEFLYTFVKTFLYILDELVDLKYKDFSKVYSCIDYGFGLEGMFALFDSYNSTKWQKIYDNIISNKDDNEIEVIESIAEILKETIVYSNQQPNE